MTFFNDTPTNITTLAALFGFEEATAHGWLRAEGQARYVPSNPLNIQCGGVTYPLQVGCIDPPIWAVFLSPGAGLEAAHLLVAKLAPAYGYGAILAQHGSGDAMAQARAIEESNWAGSHYGSDWANGKPGLVSELTSHFLTTDPKPIPPSGVDSMLNLDGYPKLTMIGEHEPLYAKAGDVNALGFSAADAKVQILGRVYDPGGGWYLARYHSGLGWSDGVSRDGGYYVHLVEPVAWVK